MLKKILKIVGIIFLILLVLFLIYFIRNFMIINKIVNSYDKFFTSNNYSVQNNYTNMESQIITIAYKDNKKLTSFSNANSIYSITWQDFSTISFYNIFNL